MPSAPTPPAAWPAPGAVPMGLVGGTGRSGTTALRDALALHPDVLAFPELRFAVDPDGLVDVYRQSRAGWSPYHADVCLRRLEALLRRVARDAPAVSLPARVARRLGLDRRLGRALPAYLGHRALDVCPTFLDHADRLVGTLTDYAYSGAWTGTPGGAPARVRVGGPYDPAGLAETLGGFWRAVAADSLAYGGRRFFLDKQTWSVLWFDAVLDLLPEARLVHVVRDPRDVAASTAAMRWGPSDPALAARWTASVLARWAEVRAAVPAGRVLEVRLEDVAADPEGPLRQVCAFLGLGWHDALLAFDWSHARTGRWRSAPGAAEIGRQLAPWAEAYGYDRA